MKYHFKVHREKGGYWAQCIELEGCITQANSYEELEQKMKEALNLYIQEPEDSEDLAPFPKRMKTSRSVVEVAVDPEIAFAFMMRACRLKGGYTQKEIAKKLGFETLYSYQRLEGKRCNPSLKMLSRIKQVFPEFSVDYAISF